MAAVLRDLLKQIEPQLISAYRRLTEPRPPNLRGDRDIEYSWVLAHLPPGQGGRALDFGCGYSYVALAAALNGFRTTAVDLRRVEWPYAHENLTFIEGDVRELQLPENSFDLIINCSSVEHVGLARYGDTTETDGDLVAMGYLRRLLKSAGMMLMTIPVGNDAVVDGLHRVYGEERLPQLLSGYEVRKSDFWVKDDRNRWVLSSEVAARQTVGTATLYALGCFLLTRPDHSLD